MPCLVIRCAERDLTLPLDLAADLAMQGHPSQTNWFKPSAPPGIWLTIQA